MAGDDQATDPSGSNLQDVRDIFGNQIVLPSSAFFPATQRPEEAALAGNLRFWIIPFGPKIQPFETETTSSPSTSSSLPSPSPFVPSPTLSASSLPLLRSSSQLVSPPTLSASSPVPLSTSSVSPSMDSSTPSLGSPTPSIPLGSSQIPSQGDGDSAKLENALPAQSMDSHTDIAPSPTMTDNSVMTDTRSGSVLSAANLDTGANPGIIKMPVTLTIVQTFKADIGSKSSEGSGPENGKSRTTASDDKEFAPIRVPETEITKTETLVILINTLQTTTISSLTPVGEFKSELEPTSAAAPHTLSQTLSAITQEGSLLTSSTALAGASQGNQSAPSQTGPGGIPTASNAPPVQGGPITPDAQGKFFNLRTEADYMVVSILPMLLATLLSFPLQILTSAVSHILPFRALGHPKGALAADSLCLPRGTSFRAPVIATRFRKVFTDPIPFLNLLLVVMSIMSIPLSSETIRLEYAAVGTCMAETVCPIGLRKNETPTRIAEGLLASMAAVLLVTSWVLWRWRSGIGTEPWSMATMMTLTSTSQDQVRKLVLGLPRKMQGERIGEDEIVKFLQEHRFRLGYYLPPHQHSRRTSQQDEDSKLDYGIHILSDKIPDDSNDNGSVRLTVRDPPIREALKQRSSKRGPDTDLTVKYIIRLVALLFHLGLFILILYYEVTILPDTPFERFMDSQSFGVRFVFSSFGTVVSLFWDYYFSYMSEEQVYRSLYAAPLTARQSILRPVPSSVFIGLWNAMFNSTNTVNVPEHHANSRTTTGTSRAGPGHQKPSGNILMTNITIAAFIAKFTPIMFSAIPFRNTVTWKMHESCTWLAIAKLVYMFIVLFFACVPVASLLFRFNRWFRLIQCRAHWGHKTAAPQVRWPGIRPEIRNKRQAGKKNDQNDSFYLPLRPPASTIAAYMYYLCESEAMLADFSCGMEMMSRKDRDRMVEGPGKRYVYGRIQNRTDMRMGVDYF